MIVFKIGIGVFVSWMLICLISHYHNYKFIDSDTVHSTFIGSAVLGLLAFGIISLIGLFPCLTYNYSNLGVENVTLSRIVFPTEIVVKDDIVYVPGFTNDNVFSNNATSLFNNVSDYAVFSWDKDYTATVEVRVNGNPKLAFWEGVERFFIVPRDNVDSFVKNFGYQGVIYDNQILDDTQIKFPHKINTINFYEYVKN